MSTSLNAIDQIFRLKELRSAGILTDEEFESKKAEVLKVAPLELSDDPVESLAQLGELRGYGILTNDEFEARKAEILTLAPISTSLNAIDQLFRLKELRSAGILTDEEFESKKAEVLKVAPLELSDDPVESLAQLGELRGYRILTNDEFEARKAEILTLGPLGLAADAEQAPAAAVPPRRSGRPALATIGVIVAVIIIWRILASGGGGVDDDPTTTTAKPATAPEPESELHRGFCHPDPCIPLGTVDPHTSPGPNGIGMWVTVRAERPEHYDWSTVKEQLAYSVVQTRVCIGSDDAQYRYRLTITRTNVWYVADTWLLADDGRGPPFRDVNNDDELDDNIDHVWGVRVMAFGGDKGQPVREPLSTPEFRLQKGCYYLVAEDGIAVLQRLEQPEG